MSIPQAEEFLFTGERIYALTADNLRPAALELAHKLAALPPQALQDTKRTINLHLNAAAGQMLPYALAAEAVSFGQPDVARIAREFAPKMSKG